MKWAMCSHHNKHCYILVVTFGTFAERSLLRQTFNSNSECIPTEITLSGLEFHFFIWLSELEHDIIKYKVAIENPNFFTEKVPVIVCFREDDKVLWACRAHWKADYM